jgi:spermidine synthase
VKPWLQLGRASAPGGGTLELCRRDREFVIRVDGVVLMSSRQHASEERLAHVGCARLGPAPCVLVGGLGMGFTLRAALDLLPARGTAVVAELVPEVVDWNRTVLADLAGQPLADPRVRVHVGDVADVMRGRGLFDAILLDVDNSPHALTRSHNQALYGRAGVAAALGALRPGGCLAVWSAARAPDMAARMRQGGFTVEEHEVRADRGGGRQHIVAGRVPGAPAPPRRGRKR